MNIIVKNKTLLGVVASTLMTVGYIKLYDLVEIQLFLALLSITLGLIIMIGIISARFNMVLKLIDQDEI